MCAIGLHLKECVCPILGETPKSKHTMWNRISSHTVSSKDAFERIKGINQNMFHISKPLPGENSIAKYMTIFGKLHLQLLLLLLLLVITTCCA